MKHILTFSFMIVLLISFNTIVPAQNSDKEILVKMSDYIVNNTEYKFIDKSTGEIYSSTSNLPVNKDMSIKDQFNFWQYPNAIIHQALIKMYDLTGEEKYKTMPVRFYDFFFSNVSFMKKMYDSGFRNWDFFWFFRMTNIDDCGPLALGLIDVNKIDPRPEYSGYIKKTEELIMNYHTEDGAWARPAPFATTSWIDDLFMGVPFIAKMGHEKADVKYFDYAARQIIQSSKYLYDPLTGLYFHNYYFDRQQPGIAHWGRANGWLLMAQIGLLEYMPENHPLRDSILAIYDRQIYGLSKYQSQSGLWHQLLDKQDSYLETSCSAMFTYAVAKGVNEGWLDKRYSGIALEGWKGLITKIDKDGAVLDVCQQTGISDNLVFYYKRPAPYNDFHGTGAIMLAGLEVIKLKENIK